MRTGAHERVIVAQSAQRGLQLPKEIREAPELLPTLELFWMCYFDLRRGLDRMQGLSWRDVQYWCDTYGLRGDLARACHDYTAVMDQAWIPLQPKPKEKGK